MQAFVLAAGVPRGLILYVPADRSGNPHEVPMPRTDRRIAAAVSLACAALLAGRHAQAIVAFPGAEGFGANATGGRGGDVYHVTTLADDPNRVIPGSLYYGLYEKHVPPEGRTIVFDVGGTIQLGSTALDIAKNISKVTIAGQTAPSPITIVGNSLQITGSSGKVTSNIILQHLNLRKGTASGEDALSIKGSGNTHNIIVDHVSGSWSEDEVISVTQGATNVTVQNSTLSEALTNSHAYGALIRPSVDSNVSYNRNLFSNQKSRNPRPGSYNGRTLNFEFQNNLIYNWSDRAGYIAGADTNVQIMNMNYAGNYLIAGPSTTDNSTGRKTTAFYRENNAHPLELHVYQQGNLIDINDTAQNQQRDGADTGWNMFKQLTGGVMSNWAEADKMASRFAYPASSPDPADIAYAKTIGQVGAFPWARSATDQRLVNDVQSYTGFAPITAPPANEWNAIIGAPTVTRPANWDTEIIGGNYFGTTTPRPPGDGMPTWWEVLRGYNPNVADNNVVTADGYTRLEKYLHYLSAQANWNLNADGNWSDHINWRGMRPESYDATANFVAGITAPRTVNVDMPATAGIINFSSPIAYTLAGSNTLTMDVPAGIATIDVIAGSHAISAPLALAKSTRVTVAQAADTLTISNLQPTAATLTKAGPGTLVVNNARAAAISVEGGKVQVAANGGDSGTSRAASVNTTAGQLDLTNNKLIVTSGAVGTWNGSNYSGVSGQIRAGRNGGPAGTLWNGHGIVTSQSDASSSSMLTTLAVATAGSVGKTSFGGVSVAGSDVLVMYTYAGDANLSGTIDGDDYFRLDSGFGSSATGYVNGDFDYNGVINADDYWLIDRNYHRQGEALLGGVSTVPEPAATAALALAAAVGMRRRRRC